MCIFERYEVILEYWITYFGYVRFGTVDPEYEARIVSKLLETQRHLRNFRLERQIRFLAVTAYRPVFFPFQSFMKCVVPRLR